MNSHKLSKKRSRTSFNSEQVAFLEKIFNQTHYPDTNLRDEICRKTNLTETKIQVGFINQIASSRRSNEVFSSFQKVWFSNKY